MTLTIESITYGEFDDTTGRSAGGGAGGGNGSPPTFQHQFINLFVCLST